MKKNYLLLILFATSCFFTNSFSQNIGNQGGSNPPVQPRSYCLTATFMDLDNKAILDNPSEFYDLTNIHFYVKLYFHVIRLSNGTGGQTASSVNQAYNILKNDYINYAIHLNWDGNIDYINNSTYYNSPNSNIFNVNRHTDGVDIYLFSNSSTAGGLANGVGTSAQLFVSGSYWNSPYGSLITSRVISHELGHVFGLWHTHHGTYPEGGNDNPCPELVNGSNSAYCGDYVTDTPADPHIMFSVNASCGWLGSGTDANGQPYNPDTRNIMSYTSPDCMSYFTVRQAGRMRKALRSLPFLQAVSTFGYEPLTKNQDNNSTKKSVTVYPNPVDGDILNVKIEGDDFRKTNSNYEFFDINNNKISSGKFDKLISTQNLKGGNYVLKLNIGGEIITKKIIINHKNK